MVSFTLSLIALVLGYLLYGRFVERVFAPDDRVTPAVAKADGTITAVIAVIALLVSLAWFCIWYRKETKKIG